MVEGEKFYLPRKDILSAGAVSGPSGDVSDCYIFLSA